MTCIHAQTLKLSAKCDDRCTTVWPDGSERTDYVPRIAGIGSGDYLSIEVCVDCRELLYFEPDEIAEAQRAEQGLDSEAVANCVACGNDTLEYQFEENALVCTGCGVIVEND